MAGPLDIYNFVQGQGEIGRQRGQRNRLAELAGQAYNAPQSQQRGLVAQAIQNDPQSGFQLGQSLDSDRTSRMTGLSQRARMLVGYAEAGNAQGVNSLYPQLAEEAESLGLGQGIPRQWNDSFLDGMKQLATLGGGAKQNEQFTLGPGSKRFDASGNVVAEVPFAPANANIVKVPDGMGGTIDMVWDPRTRQLVDLPVPGTAPTPQPGQWAQPGQVYQTPSGIVRIDPNIDPDALAGVQADIEAGGQGNDYRLPDRNVTPQQRGSMGYTPPKQPNAPAGYRMNPDGTMSMIPGGPAQVAADARADAAAARSAAEELKASQKRQEAAARQAESATAANQLVAAIDSLVGSDGFQSLGTVMGDIQLATPLIRSGAKDANAQLKNIAGQVALSTMARLKALSSSGATGFGALSAPELKLLENAIATLQSDQISNEELRRSLMLIRNSMERIAGWSGGDEAQSNAVQPSSDIDSLLDMYR